MFYHDRDGQTPPLSKVGLPRTPAAILSAGLVLGALALAVARPDLLADRASLAERGAQALLFVGTIGNLIHAAGIQPGRRLSRLAADPRIAWPATLLGAAYFLWMS